MDRERLRAELKADEGVRHTAYTCPAGKTTIGVGRNLDDTGLDDNEVNYLLDGDIERCIASALSVFPYFHHLPDAAQHVIVNMLFQLGEAGFRQFKRFIEAVETKRWHHAADEVLDSRAARQTPARFNRHAEALRNLANSGEAVV